MAESFLGLSTQDRRDALGVASDRSGRPPHLLEKDVWVVWALAALYASPLGQHLVFKGGTSLSKDSSAKQYRPKHYKDFTRPPASVWSTPSL